MHRPGLLGLGVVLLLPPAAVVLQLCGLLAGDSWLSEVGRRLRRLPKYLRHAHLVPLLPISLIVVIVEFHNIQSHFPFSYHMPLTDACFAYVCLSLFLVQSIQRVQFLLGIPFHAGSTLP